MLKKACERDSCDVYSEHVAMKLRKYNERTRSIVQHLFNNILFEADMGKYSDVSTLNYFSAIRSNTFVENRNSVASPAAVSSNCSNANSHCSPRTCTPQTRPVTPNVNESAIHYSVSNSVAEKATSNGTCTQFSKLNSCLDNFEACSTPSNNEVLPANGLPSPNNLLTPNAENSHLIVL